MSRNDMGSHRRSLIRRQSNSTSVESVLRFLFVVVDLSRNTDRRCSDNSVYLDSVNVTHPFVLSSWTVFHSLTIFVSPLSITHFVYRSTSTVKLVSSVFVYIYTIQSTTVHDIYLSLFRSVTLSFTTPIYEKLQILFLETMVLHHKTKTFHLLTQTFLKGFLINSISLNR